MKSKYRVILFYKFKKIKNPQRIVESQRKLCEDLGLKGRILVAKEGINATLEGKVRDINKYKKNFKNIIFKESEGNGKAFTRLEIKVRKEVVTLGAGEFDVKRETAKEITAKELHDLYKNKREDFVVLDLRNDFEIKAGYFENSINPNLQNFRELPSKIEGLKARLNDKVGQDLKNKKIVAVCTGGVRCEKGTCLLKRAGFKNLYQLKDGIHTYMQKYPGQNFKGSLFVFDNRMTTPVVDTPNREIVGQCIYCNKKCEEFASNDSVRPSRKVICCNKCFQSHTDTLRRCTPK